MSHLDSTIFLGLFFFASAAMGCSARSDPSSEPASGDDQELTVASTLLRHVDCTVKGPGVQDVDDAVRFSFEVRGLGTAHATFEPSGWKVLDGEGHELTSDGAHSSLLAEGFEHGVDIHQCRAVKGKPDACGSLVLSLDDSSSEIPVTISLTKKSGYRTGRITVDNTINTGDDSGWLHAPIECSLGS